MTVREALQFLKNQLSPLLGAFAVPQSEEILEYLLQLSRSNLYISANSTLPLSLETRMKAILTKRLNGTPLPYIIGNSYFYSREFLVTPDVLIPRPDTETLIELVLMHESKSESIFADIGLGSGIISCILTETVPLWKAVGVDISYPALKVAQKNCHTPVMLLCADMLSAFKPGKIFDFIVSNPPYISQDEMDTLDPEVRNFEPVTALCGGSDGLDFYRYLALESKKVLKKTGRIYCEIGYNQQISVFDIFSNQGWSKIKTEKDLGGNPRVLMAELQD